MKHISRKLSLELASFVLVLIVAAAGVLAWRLSKGPTQVDFLKPFVETGFFAATGQSLAMDHLTVSASDSEAPIVIAMTGVEISQGGQIIATIDQASAALSHHGLLIGRFLPLTVAIDHPVINLISMQRRAAPEPQETSHPLRTPNILARLSNPKPEDMLARWEKVVIKNGAAMIGDAALASQIDVTLQRTPVGLRGTLQGASQDGGPIAGAIEVNRGQKGSASLEHVPFLVSQLGMIPGLGFLQNDMLPIDATVTANLDDAAIADARADLEIGAGQIVESDFLPGPVEVAGGRLELVYQAKPERIELRRFDLDLGGPHIGADGHADTIDGQVKADIDAKISDMPIDRFAEFWPPGVSVGGRRWVLANLSKGMVPLATAHILAAGPRADPSQMTVTSLDGTIGVTGATVHYFGELPAVKDTSADITYDEDSMTINLTGGTAEDLALTGGTVILDGFRQAGQTIKIDINLSGQVAKALDLVDHKPLNYAQKLGLRSAEFGGTADTRLQMAFPLVSDVSVEQLNLMTQSQLHDVSMPNAVDHMDMKALNGTLYIGTGGLELQGTGALIDIPLTLDYKQSFEKNGAIAASFSGPVDDRQRGELGLDFADRLQGPVNVAGKYNAQGAASTVDVALDMTPSTFAVDEIGYVKPPGQAGTAKFLVTLQNGKLKTINPLTVEAPKFSAEGSAAFDPETGKLTTLTLIKLKADDTDMSVVVTPLDDGGTKIDATGSEFDARRFLHKRRERKAEPEAQVATDPAALEINIDLATVKTSDTDGLTAVKGQLILLGQKWRRADFTASANGTPIFLSYLPDSSVMYPSYTLNAGAQDAGAALAGFALTNSVKGGALAIKGAKPAPSDDQPNPPLSGGVSLTNFSVANAPGFARLFNLLSVTGFSKAISSANIHFDSFKSKFAIDNSELRLADGKLRGDALGLTLAGTIDRDAGTMNLYGTVVPAYGANRILNSIPVLGPLLTGGDGQGIFAATYSITGPYENANVSLNPLSVFAPGVLRDVLFGTSDPDMDSGN